MLKLVETFSGIGAQKKALSNTKIPHEILHTADWDINAILAYDYIHNGAPKPSKFDSMSKEDVLKYLSKFTLSFDGKKPTTYKNLEKQNVDFLRKLCYSIERSKNLISVTDIKGEDLPNDMNMLTYSFPCQDLSTAGFWHGNKGGIDRNANNRSSMLWQIERILLERKNKNLPMPRFLLMENVREIMAKRNKANFEMWKDSLKNMGYYNKVFSLNASNFGVPQKRVRAYMISIYIGSDLKLESEIDNFFKNNNLESNSENGMIKPRKSITIPNILKIQYENEIYKSEALQSQPNDTKSRRAIYENNQKLLSNGVFANIAPTLTTKQDRHPNSGVIDFDIGNPNKSKFRYLTPRESFLLMGFDEEDFNALLDNNFIKGRNKKAFNNEKLYKMAGNSIAVNVLEEIFKLIDKLNRTYFNE